MQSEIYEGQFGNFTIEPSDRREVVIYRTGLAIAAFSFAIGTGVALQWGTATWAMQLVSVCYGVLWVALGVSLKYVHIYLRSLHRTLQAFWAIGGIASLGIAIAQPGPLALTAYQQPLTILGIGFTFAALTGIFFKEAFCFNRFETKLLVPIVPLMLLGHMVGFLSPTVELALLLAWALLFGIFALRKGIQPIPPDIGDKSVFTYLAQQRQQSSAA